MRLVYVAGPYRSPLGMNGVHANIEAARSVARALWLMGFAVICPHTNTAMMDGSDIPDHIWLDGDLKILERCDLVVVLPNWQTSEGTKGEIHHAAAHGIRTLYWPEDREAIELAALEPTARSAVSAAARLLVGMRKAGRRVREQPLFGLFTGRAS